MQPEVQQRLLIRSILFFWAVTRATGWGMWLADRSFPMAPPFEWMYAVPAEVHLLSALVTLFFMSWLFQQPERWNTIPYLLLMAAMSDLLDQNRWQPWEYLFATLLLVIYINRRNTNAMVGMIMFVVAALYFYSGVSKFHEGFLYSTWQPMFLKQLPELNTAVQHSALMHLGYSIPLVETLAAVGLLFPGTRKQAAVLLMLMHAILLLLVGPTGMNYNWIIWPWNMGMIVLLYVLTFKTQGFKPETSVLVLKANMLIVLLWGVLPLTYYLDLWDAYPSAQLYSGRIYHAAICVPAGKVPPGLQPYVTSENQFRTGNGTVAISLNNWAMAETNVPPYPEIRVYRKIKQRFDHQFPGTNASLIIIRYPYTRKEVINIK